MIEPISYEEVMSNLEKKLNERLKRARVFPRLLQSCQPAASRVKDFREIRKLGAELYLASKDYLINKRKFWVHPIPEERLKLFTTCRELGFHEHFTLDRELYVNTHTPYRGKVVLVHLGEWRPFVEFSGDPLEMSSKEFTELCKKIKRYTSLPILKKYAPIFKVLEERFADGRPVFLMRNLDRSAKEYRFVANVSSFTEYGEAYVEYTKEDREREERAEAEKFHEELKKHEELMGRGSIINVGEDITLSEVSPEDVERTLNIPVKEVAEKALAIKSISYLFDGVDIGVLTPLKHIHALRYLMDAGVEAGLVRSEALKLKLGIRVYSNYVGHNYYNVVIIPKKLHQLPQINLAKVIRTPKRIIVVSPQTRP